jgi:cellobiose phosphorylase
MPKEWASYKIHYRFRQTVYHITIARLAADSIAESRLTLDGQEISGTRIPLIDDSHEHAVELAIR